MHVLFGLLHKELVILHGLTEPLPHIDGHLVYHHRVIILRVLKVV